MGLMINPAPTFTLNNGDIASEGLLYFFENGSTTVKKAIYSNSNLTTELINPLPLTDAGRLPTCFGDGTYTIILKSSDDVQQWVRNDVTIGDLAGQFSDYSSVKTYSVNEIVRYVDGNYYYSLQNNNKGNAPSENSEFWAQIAFLEFFNTAKAADEDYMENDIVIFGGFIFRSLEDDNGDTPPSAKWANLTFNDSVAGNFTVGGTLTADSYAGGGVITQTVPGGTLVCHKSALQAVTASTTLVDATDMVLELESGIKYHVVAHIEWANGGTTANGIKVTFSGASVSSWMWTASNNTSTANASPVSNSNGGLLQFTKMPNTAGAAEAIIFDAVVVGSGTDFKMQFAQAVSDATGTSILTGTMMKATRLN